MKNTYSQKLRDPRWQKKRLEIFNRDNWTCQSCGSDSNNLQIHHLKYHQGKNPWEYDNQFLVTYCEVCHESEHLIGDTTREILLELLELDKLYYRPLAQLCILIEKHNPFYNNLKSFLNDEMIKYLKSKTPTPNEILST
jgi:5-methylcytosine-specific restriction endonuclease McrA